jgi:hypothetical protein
MCLCIGVADWVADVTVEVTSWGEVRDGRY